MHFNARASVVCRISHLALFLFLAGSCLAASVPERVYPDPVSYEDFYQLLSPLSLAEAQENGIDAAHEQYFKAWQDLRNGPMKDSWDLESISMGLSMVDRSQVVESVKSRESIFKLIDGLESSLMSSISEVLSEDQQKRLPRIADRRTRARLSLDPRSDFMSTTSLQSRDLSFLMTEIQMEQDELDAVDDVLGAYEARITSLVRSIHRARLDSVVDQYDLEQIAMDLFDAEYERLAKAHAAEEGEAASPVELIELVEASLLTNPLVEQHLTGVSPSAKKIHELHERHLRENRIALSALAELMNAEGYAQVEHHLVSRGYPMLQFVPGRAGDLADTMHSDPKLVADVQQAAEQIGMQYRQDRHRLIAKALREVETSGAILDQPVYMMHEPVWEPLHEKLESHRDDLWDLDQQAMVALGALKGERLVPEPRPKSESGVLAEIMLMDEASDAAVVIDAEDSVMMLSMFMAADDDAAPLVLPPGSIEIGRTTAPVDAEISQLDMDLEVDQSMVQQVSAPDTGSTARQWIPGPIAREWLSSRITCSSDELDIIDVLYQEYQIRWQQLETDVLTPVRLSTAGHGLDMPDPERHDPEVIARDLKSAMGQIHELDSSFLDQVGSSISWSEDELNRVIRARRRVAHQHGIDSGFMQGLLMASREEEVDLLELGIGMPLSDQDRDMVAHALQAYDIRADELHAQRWSENIENTKLNAQAFLRAVEAMEEGGAVVWPNGEDGIMESARRLAELDTQLRELNRSSLDHFDGSLTSDGSNMYRLAFDKAAFPAAMHDPESVHRILEKAMVLDVLMEHHPGIEEIRLEYQIPYQEVCDRMIARMRSFTDEFDGPEGLDSMAAEIWKAEEAIEFQLRSDRLERGNLNDRARRKLAQLIGPEHSMLLGLKSVSD